MKVRESFQLWYFKKAFKYLSLAVLILSCNSRKQDSIDEMPALYPPPLTVNLNTDEGYFINPLTGDSIQPIINSYGDTVKTGVPVPITGRVIPPDSVTQPNIITAGKPEVVPAQQNVHEIPKNLTVIPVNRDILRTYKPGVDIYRPFTLVSSAGDTIPTGVPIPAKGKDVPCIHPQPDKAMLPLIKDNAIIDIKYLDVEHGMNSGFVNSMLEDNRGNIWMGLERVGVSKYNGESFTHFTQKEGFSNSDVQCMLEDSQGNLWFGTVKRGVSMHNGETFTHFTQDGGLCDNIVQSILEDRHGNLWFGTRSGGVSKYNGETFTHFTEKEGLVDNDVRSILEDRHGNLWFGTRSGGVSKFNGETFTHITRREGLISNFVWAILEDKHGNFWFGQYGGVSMYNGETITHFTEKEGLINNVVRSIQEDNVGNLWFATSGGVSMYNGKTFTNFTQIEGLNYTNVKSIQEDSHGNLWFGTSGGGMSIYTVNSFKHFTENDGLCNSFVQSILEDSQGRLWFGTRDGVSMYNGKTFTHLTENEGIDFGNVRSILEDSQGNLWFGSYGGVSSYNGETITDFTEEQGLSNQDVRYIMNDSHGNLWFGTIGGGVSMYNGEAFTRFTEKEGLSNNDVISILEDSYGNLWFATGGGGVSRYNGETLTNFTRKEGLINNNVKSILEDSHGNLWFGTFGGLSLFNGETFTQFTEKEGLIDNDVRSIQEDSQGNIWVGTGKGLNFLMYDPESNFLLIHNYIAQDGLKGMDFNRNSVFSDSKNRIWWGHSKGLAMLDMNIFKIPVDSPTEMQLNRIEINGKFSDFRNLKEQSETKLKFDGVPKFYNYPENLIVPHRQNHLTFYFSAIDWSAPHKLMYSYKMEGVRNANWSVPSTETKADYRNLPQGTFTFTVRAIGAAQKWGEPFKYTFTILPPWWFNWWAYIIYGIIFISIIDQYRRYLLRRAKLRSAVEVGRIEKEKLLELDHMKSRFFANISHEFRTPLTLIKGPLEGLLKKKSKEVTIERDELSIIHRNAGRIQDLINQLLDISKLETGRVKLQVSEGDLTEFIRRIVLSFLSLAESKEIGYEYDLPDCPVTVYFDGDKLEKILTNLVSNAFKFTSPEGNIKIILKYNIEEGKDAPGNAEIFVRDSGKGIPQHLIDKIFDRFYQVGSSDTREQEGTGIGLSLTKELVNIYGGDIKVESEEGKGSLFTVILPVSREQFAEEEILSSESGNKDKLESQSGDILEDIPDDNVLSVIQTDDDSDRPLVLIVEDNADLRKYISQNLDSTYRVQTVVNGKDGLEKATRDIPDLIISDVMMPEMDGMEMCTKLKQDKRTDHIPLIMLTAKADRDSKIEGLQTGVDDYLIKPFDAEELKVRVKNILDQRKLLRVHYRKEFEANDPFTVDIPSGDGDFLTKVVDTIKSHLGESEYSVEQLGNEVGFSRSQFYRKIMALTGYPPHEFIRNIRLKQAARMFREGNTNVTQVLYTVGFNSPSYFTKSFRELFGINPSDFILELKSS